MIIGISTDEGKLLFALPIAQGDDKLLVAPENKGALEDAIHFALLSVLNALKEGATDG